MQRVVYDTNIYVSAFITPGGRGEAAWRRAIDEEIRLFTSLPILTELARILRDKFGWDDVHLKTAVRHAAAIATLVRPTQRLAVLNDEPDNRILECALAAEAELIVTGDRHLLALGRHEGIAIITLAEFLAH